MNKLKEHKSIIIVAALIFLLSGCFQLGSWYAQYKQEISLASAKQASPVNPIEAYAVPDEISLAFAKELLQSIPDAPLMAKNAENPDSGNSSLEAAINDVNAASSAKEAILRICKEASIDANKATVQDLTAEQIGEIDQEVYQQSNHPKK